LGGLERMTGHSSMAAAGPLAEMRSSPAIAGGV
jgi:hypothetical protein